MWISKKIAVYYFIKKYIKYEIVNSLSFIRSVYVPDYLIKKIFKRKWENNRYESDRRVLYHRHNV